MTLENLGVPTALIVTSEFVHEAKMQRTALGLPSLATAVIDHPLSTVSQEEIERRAAQALPQVKSIWLTGSAGNSATM